jgi:DNA-binding transcriptional regulator YiaG
MMNLAIALRDEIRRLARKEIKSQTGRTAQKVAQHRREIALLKRQQRELEKKVVRLQAQLHQTQSTPAVVELNGDARYSARSVKAQRRRTGLSAADYAKLVGVSALTIYNWENQKSRPRQEQQAALVGLRGLGKREAKAKLDLLATANKKLDTRRRRRRPN